MPPAAIYSSPAVPTTTTTSIGTIQEQVPRSELSLEHRLDCAVQCAGQFRGLGLKSSSWYLVFSCRGRLFLHSRHRESKNKRHPTCLFILWNICGKQENDKHPCSKSNIFDLWNFRNIIYTFDRAEFRFEIWTKSKSVVENGRHLNGSTKPLCSTFESRSCPECCVDTVKILCRYWVDTV